MRRGMWISGALSGITAVTVLAIAVLGPPSRPPWEGPVVPAIVQTANAYGEGDTADDVAIWVHPSDAALSLVIGTNKGDPGGLQVFDLTGEQRQFAPSGRLNNVDLRDGFPFAGSPGTLVAASNRSDDTVEFFRIDPVARRLEPLRPVPTGLDEVYGLCLYRSAGSGRFYVFVTSEEGPVRQYELAGGAGGIRMTEVRRWELSSEGEGCVADDQHGQLYLTQEARGLWKFPAEPEESTTSQLLSTTARDAQELVADVEGVTLYDAGGGDGYILVSSQGSSTFAVYSRREPHHHLGSFAVVDGDEVDGATNTDGLAVTDIPVDGRFPAGMLVVHDQHNRGADTSNFKYVSWADVSRALGLDRDETGRGTRRRGSD